MSRYVKFFSALLGGIATWGYTAAADDLISKVEWFGLIGVIGTALAVYQFPNTNPDGGAGDPEISEKDAV